jgi:hypothetical protein
MKRIHKILAGTAGALALAAVTVVVAAPREGMGGCEGPGRMGMMHAGMHGGDPAAMAERHLGELKTQLKITPQQEAVWQAFAGKATERAKAMQALHEAQRGDAAAAKLSAPDRMAQHLDVMRKQLDGMQAVQAALKDLYAQLTPEQRLVADKHAAEMGHPMGRPGPHDGPHAGPRG